MKTLNSEPRITIKWRIELRPEWGNQNWVMPGGSGAPVLSWLPARDKDAAFDFAMAMAELASVAAERDKWKTAHKIACDGWDHAAKSLRAAEQDLAEVESINSDLRTVNARLVADLAAATQRADTAEDSPLEPSSRTYYVCGSYSRVGCTAHQSDLCRAWQRIRDVRDIVTTDSETKEQLIARVRELLQE